MTYEWERPDGVRAPELATTWARLEIWAGDECVTQVEDRESRAARRSIYCSLYPLAEWIAFNWWSLNVNVRLAGAVTSPIHVRKQFPTLRAHRMRSAGDGFLWPDLVVVPEGHTTRIVWRGDREALPGAPIRFIGDGAVVCDASSVQAAFRAVVENVLARLDENGVQDTALADEWRTITSADPDEVDYCVAAARLGLDPYSVGNGMAELLEKIGSRLDKNLLDDFLNAANPDALESGVIWIRRTVGALQELRVQPNPVLQELHKAVHMPVGRVKPWTLGWDQARQVRKVMDVEADEAFDVEKLVMVREEPYGDRGLIALGGETAEGGHALVAARAMPDDARRFASARALWHFTVAPTARFLLTTSHSDRQKVERAFAAELLAPAEGVERLIAEDEGVVGFEDLEYAAEHFEVSPLVVRHQVENQLELAIAD